MKASVPPSPPPFEFLLDARSGVPAYRQIIDQVQAGVATGALGAGHQLPTVRQVALLRFGRYVGPALHPLR